MGGGALFLEETENSRTKQPGVVDARWRQDGRRQQSENKERHGTCLEQEAACQTWRQRIVWVKRMGSSTAGAAWDIGARADVRKKCVCLQATV